MRATDTEGSSGSSRTSQQPGRPSQNMSPPSPPMRGPSACNRPLPRLGPRRGRPTSPHRREKVGVAFNIEEGPACGHRSLARVSTGPADQASRAAASESLTSRPVLRFCGRLRALSSRPSSRRPAVPPNRSRVSACVASTSSFEHHAGSSLCEVAMRSYASSRKAFRCVRMNSRASFIESANFGSYGVCCMPSGV